MVQSRVGPSCYECVVWARSVSPIYFRAFGSFRVAGKKLDVLGFQLKFLFASMQTERKMLPDQARARRTEMIEPHQTQSMSVWDVSYFSVWRAYYNQQNPKDTRDIYLQNNHLAQATLECELRVACCLSLKSQVELQDPKPPTRFRV